MPELVSVELIGEFCSGLMGLTNGKRLKYFKEVTLKSFQTEEKVSLNMTGNYTYKMKVC